MLPLLLNFSTAPHLTTPYSLSRANDLTTTLHPAVTGLSYLRTLHSVIYLSYWFLPFWRRRRWWRRITLIVFTSFLLVDLACVALLATTLLFPDVDECATNNGGCDTNATCVNTIGSYFCYCKLGFVGDGNNYCDGTDWLCHCITVMFVIWYCLSLKDITNVSLIVLIIMSCRALILNRRNIERLWSNLLVVNITKLLHWFFGGNIFLWETACLTLLEYARIDACG